MANLTGQTFNRLTVIEHAPKGVKGWRCRCVCGAERFVFAVHLLSGATKSCGCLSRERVTARNTTHRGTGTPEYRVWAGAKNRCHNPNNDCYADYGGRGIVMCERWRNDFAAFLADMGQRPSPQHQIDRIDSNGPYAPENCRWATVHEQQNNRRSNVRVTIEGVGMTLKQAAQRHAVPGVTYHTVQERIHKFGWTLHDALTIPNRLNTHSR